MTSVGTPLFAAPEIHNHKKYDNKVDVWSFGTMIYETLIGFPPFIAFDLSVLKMKLNNGEYVIPKNLDVSLDLLRLIDECL